MRLSLATHNAIKYACMNFHYAKRVPIVFIAYNVYNGNDEWCGVIVYGNGATTNIGKQYDLGQGQIYELVRVALNGKQECTSQAVSMSLKQLHKDRPLCRLVISYADCDHEHLGTIYQATNWIYQGQFSHSKRGGFIIHGKLVHPRSICHKKVIDNGVKRNIHQSLEDIQRFIDKDATEYHTKGKRKYLMPMDKAMRRQIMPLAKPYPKTDADWKKIDRNKFKEANDGKPEL